MTSLSDWNQFLQKNTHATVADASRLRYLKGEATCGQVAGMKDSGLAPRRGVPGVATTRCDLHLHSSASRDSEEWFTRFFGCPESYAPPLRQYELCKERGMSLVTLTDHDTIAGGLTLLDRPDFFLSEEVTAVFPENGCVMHVLAWDITQAQHEVIQDVRRDIYRLCEFLNSAGIAHALAHPLLSPNWRLDADTFEKILLLFPALEGVNGLTDRRIESDLSTVLDRLTPEIIAALSAKHGLSPTGVASHRKALTGGSDDHTSRYAGMVCTEIAGEVSTGAFLARCMAGEGRPHGHQADLNNMMLSITHTTYHHLKERQAEWPGLGNPFTDMLDILAGREAPATPDGTTGNAFVASLLTGSKLAALQFGSALDILAPTTDLRDADDAHIVDSVTRLSDRVLERAVGELVAAAQDFDLYRLFGAVRDLAGGMAATAPALFAADYFGKQDSGVRRLFNEWSACPLPPRPERLGVFSDSLEQVDGVSTWCKRFVDRARAAGQTVLIPRCDSIDRGEEAAVGDDRLPELTSFRLPLYSPMTMHVPSPVGALQWAWRQRISHIELATPGPMGLVGLLVAKLLRLPVTASYHTELPSLVGLLGAHDLLVPATRRYLGWFYGLVDRVFAFSEASRSTLVDMGVAPGNIELMPVGVDPEAFSPVHRSRRAFEFLNLDVGDRPVVLSVGRISAEKNLAMVIDAVDRLQTTERSPVLVIVGDGPERPDLERKHRHKDYIRFAGVQSGDALKRIYASASIFVFASCIDTLGLVNMEAMASGLPVLVPQRSSIAEFVTHGISAHCYDFSASGLANAIAHVLSNESFAAQLAAGGRDAMISRWNQASFSRIWRSFTQQTRGRVV